MFVLVLSAADCMLLRTKECDWLPSYSSQVYRARMAWIFGILGAGAGVTYHMLFEHSHHPAHAAWSLWDFEVLATYGAVGFAVGWVLGFVISKIGHHDL